MSSYHKKSTFFPKPSSTTHSQFFDHYNYENYRGKTFSVQKKVPREVVRSQKYRRQHGLLSNNELEFVMCKGSEEIKRLLTRHMNFDPKQKQESHEKQKISLMKIETVRDRQRHGKVKTCSSINLAMNLFNLLEIASKAHREDLARRNERNPFHKVHLGQQNGIYKELYFEKVPCLSRLAKHPRLRGRVQFAGNFNDCVTLTYEKYLAFHRVFVLGQGSADEQLLFMFRLISLGKPTSKKSLYTLASDLKQNWPRRLADSGEVDEEVISLNKVWQCLKTENEICRVGLQLLRQF